LGKARGRVDYFVTPSSGKWKLILEYGTRSYEAVGEAIEAAVEAAHAAGKSGIAAKVLVQAADGAWNPVWTYGLDPYPPRLIELFFGIAAHRTG
jgi:hypothetical protein